VEGDEFEEYRKAFDADVFVSYARRDDDMVGRERQGWISQFHEDLVQQIRVYLGADARVWRDSDIRNNDDFERKIVNRLAKTATLLPIISASFVNSEWCQREVREFVAQAERRFGIHVDGEKKRIFKVERIPTDRNILPDDLQGTTTYKFFVDGKRPLRPSISDKDGEAYYAQIVDLAVDVADVMRLLAKEAKRVKPDDAGQVQSERAVYVAETTWDLQDKAAEISRDLKSRGFRVLPDRDLPRRAQDYRAAVADLLSRCCVSVHLIGQDYGVVPEGETQQSNVRLQHHLALDRAASANFGQLVWIADGVRTDERQLGFLKYLREDEQANAGMELLEGGLEELKTEMYDLLSRLEKAAKEPLAAAPSPGRSSTVAAAVPAAPGEPLCVYVICERTDRRAPALVALRRHLVAEGYEPMLPTEGDSERETLEEHLEKLGSCDACVIYYGEGSERWFEAKLNDIRKILRNRTKPVLAKAVYIGGPARPEKDEVETNEASVLRGGEVFDPQTLEPFLAKLRAPAA
jgi:TIR domain